MTGRTDPEDIAFDRQRQQLYWSSEGDQPWIRVAGLDGSYRGEFALPPTLAPRFNAGLEGLTVTPSGKSLFAAMEHPGSDDGEPPTESAGALARITQFDLASRAAVAQYAYPLDPITAPSGDATGLTALVAVDEDTFLTVERSHGTSNVARVYRAEVSGAVNVLDQQVAARRPAGADEQDADGRPVDHGGRACAGQSRRNHAGSAAARRASIGCAGVRQQLQPAPGDTDPGVRDVTLAEI